MTFFAGRSTRAAVSHGSFHLLLGCFLSFARRIPAEMQMAIPASGQSKPASKGRMKSSHLRGNAEGRMKNAESKYRRNRDLI